MSNASSKTQALVVGAGPGGALLSYLLASRGVETVLAERQSDFEREFRGEAMMPSGLRALAAAGVDLDGVATQDPERFAAYFRRRAVFELGLEADEVRELPRIVSQPELLEHIVSLAEGTGHFHLVRGGSVQDLLTRDGRVTGVHIRTADGGIDVEADLVVGADGRASVVRRKLALPVRSRGAPMDIVWFKLPWPEAWARGQLRGYVGGGHLLIAVPAPDGLLQVAWVILKGTYGELRKRGIEEWVHAMADHVDDAFGAYLVANRDAISRPFLLDSVTDCVDGWARPGALVIGDAAHTMSPVGGQGLNVALRDAVVAANHLVPAFLHGGDLDAAAALVEPERRPEIDEIQFLAAQPPRVVMGQRFFHGWVRGLVSVLLRSPFVRARATDVVDTFLFGTTDVELRV